ncbi:hypothetical protein ACIQXW_08295 [Lysinibacillus sp. NPDC097162]|uniref:hypothetical protein n=1 Tax=Lysinibacillus sp. NPDC097162 TaxID=3364140 RepID=UPI0037F21A4D
MGLFEFFIGLILIICISFSFKANLHQYFSITVSSFIELFLLALIILFLIAIISLIQSKRVNKTQYNEAEKLSQGKAGESVPIFTWIADEPSIEKLFFDIIGKEKSVGNFKEDILNLKQKVIDYIGENIYDYYILKNVLQQRLDGGIVNIFRATSKSVITSVVTACITTLVLNKLELDYYLSIAILLGLIGLLLYSIFSASYVFVRQKNRLEILIQIINTIIYEKEKESEKNIKED